MPSTDRRTLLATMGVAATGGLAGCASTASDEPPAGSLRFVNEHDLPHSIRFRVTGVGERPDDGVGATTGDAQVPPAQRDLAATAALAPGEQHTYDGAFTEPVWYAVAFTLDGREPEDDAGVTVFNPARRTGTGAGT